MMPLYIKVRPPLQFPFFEFIMIPEPGKPLAPDFPLA